MIARMILGYRSIIFRVASMARLHHCSSSAFFHIIMVSPFFGLSPGALSLPVHLESSPQISFHLGCNYGFLEDNRFLRGSKASFHPRINPDIVPYSSYAWQAFLCGIWNHCP
eukprot:UN27143